MAVIDFLLNCAYSPLLIYSVSALLLQGSFVRQSLDS